MTFCFGLLKFRQQKWPSESWEGETHSSVVSGSKSIKSDNEAISTASSHKMEQSASKPSQTAGNQLAKSSAPLTLAEKLELARGNMGIDSDRPSSAYTTAAPRHAQIRDWEAVEPVITDNRTSEEFRKNLPGVMDTSSHDFVPRTGSADLFGSISAFGESGERKAAPSRSELESISFFLSGVLGPVQIEEFAGQGAHGRVYKASWQNQVVAVKVVKCHVQNDNMNTDQDITSAFHNKLALEGFVGAGVEHRHIVRTLKVVLQVGASSSERKQPLASSPPLGGTMDQEHTNNPTSDVQCGSAPQPADGTQTTEESQSKQEGAVSEGGVIIVSNGSPSAMNLYMMQEFCNKGSLKNALRDGVFHMTKTDSKTQVVLLHDLIETAVEIASALEYLHSQRFVHGDLKAENILLKEESSSSKGFTTKLADFGLSRVLEQDEEEIMVSKFGAVTHMPPETLRDNLMTFSSDVYSFGILLWELYCAAKPFAHYSPFQLLNAVVQYDERPAFPSHCPAAYQLLATQCMSKAHEVRPTLAKVLEQLRAMRQEMPVEQVVPLKNARLELSRVWESHISTAAGFLESTHPGIPRELVAAQLTSHQFIMPLYASNNNNTTNSGPSGVSWSRQPSRSFRKYLSSNFLQAHVMSHSDPPQLHQQQTHPNCALAGGADLPPVMDKPVLNMRPKHML